MVTAQNNTIRCLDESFLSTVRRNWRVVRCCEFEYGTEGKDQRELRTGRDPEGDANVKADGSRKQRGGENAGLMVPLPRGDSAWPIYCARG
jgi:hypothetical protein